MRNKVGQLAIVVPWQEASADIQAHGGKVVIPVRYARCGLGEAAWHTDPMLIDGYGNSLAWDDGDLKPLGKMPTVKGEATTCTA